MRSLKGRPIGLKAFMNKEQMKKHLIKVREEWLAEGFSESEVTNAILSKVHPLLVGYYWARFPESSERLAEALRELGYPVFQSPFCWGSGCNGVQFLPGHSRPRHFQSPFCWGSGCNI